MLSEREVIGLQAEKHDLILPEAVTSPEEHNLFLIHQKAYALVGRIATRRRVLDLGCNTGYGTELRALLEAHFAHVRVKGLFADEPLYGLEVRRVRRLMEKGRRRQSKWYRLKSAFRRRRDDVPAAVTSADGASTAAFRYRGERLDAALDLLAVCASPR